MHYSYTTKGTCSSEIEFDLDGDIVHNVQFVGGCNGNLKAISSLVDGLTVEQVVDKVKGIILLGPACNRTVGSTRHSTIIHQTIYSHLFRSYAFRL